MNRPNEESNPIALRFSLRDLLLAMTIASVFMAISTLLPREVLRFLLRLLDLVFVASLVAGVMTWEGRWRIACLASLVPLAVIALGEPALGELFDDFTRLIRRLGCSGAVVEMVSFATRWVEALLSGAVAYGVAGWLTRRK